jgi:hypothetical protein
MGDKAIGWCVVAVCAGGILACAALVAKWT